MTTTPTAAPAAVFPQSKITLDFAATHKLIHGYAKTGKTTLASVMTDSQGRRPAFAATEDRHSSLNVSRIRVKSWGGFVNFVDHVEKNIETIRAQHSCICVDVISDLDAWCSSAVAAKKNVEYIGDLEMGKGWKIFGETFQTTMDKLMSLMPITFISHTAEKRQKLAGEESISQAPNLSKFAMNYINGKVDTIMFIVPAGQKKEFPSVSMRPTTGYIAGAGQPALCREFAFDPSNPAATWTEICSVYNQAQKALIATAQPAQAAN